MRNISALLLLLTLSMPLLRADDGPRLVLRSSHVEAITQVVYSPDGKLLASGSKDGTVKIWDTATGEIQSTLPVDRGPILAVVFVPSTTRILVASADGVVTDWDDATLSLIATVTGPVAAPTATALLVNSGKTMAATAGPDFKINLWTVPEQDGPAKADAVLDGHTQTVNCLTFSRDGGWLASGANGGEVRVWDVGDQSLFRTIRGHAMSIRSVAFTADGKRLADASDDGITEVYDVKTGENVVELQMNRPGDGVGAVAFSASGGMAVTGGDGGEKGNEFVDLWEVKAGAITHSAIGHKAYVTAAAFAPDGGTVATGSRDDTVRIWNAHTGASVHVLGGIDEVPSLTYARNGAFLVTASGDGVVRIWSATSGELVHAFPTHSGAANAVAVTPDGKWIVSGGGDKIVRVSDFDTGASIRTFACSGPVHALAISADGTLIAAGSGVDGYDGDVRVWKAAGGPPIADINSNSSLSAVRNLAFSADGSQLAVASGITSGGQASVWDSHSGKQLFQSDDELGRVRGVALSSDGRRFVIASAVAVEHDDGSVELKGPQAFVWNAQTFSAERTITNSAEDDAADAVAIAPDGRTAVLAGLDGQLMVWDIKTGEKMRTFGGHLGAVLSLAIAPDGAAAASSGADGTVRIWDVAAGRERAALIPVNLQAADAMDWVAVTPEGYYDSSPGAAREIRWQLGSAAYSVEAFESMLHKPDEVAKSLAGQPVTELPVSERLGGGGALPPTVTFTTPHDGDKVAADSVPITVDVVGSTTPQLTLFANGRPVADSAKPLELGAKPLELGAKPLDLGDKAIEVGAKAIELGAKSVDVGGPTAPGTEFTTAVPFQPGDTSLMITAVAVGDSNLQGRGEIRVERPDAVGAVGKLYVLAVGVSKYQNPHFDLKYAASDADTFAALWKSHVGNLYDAVDVTELIDDQASASNVRSALFKLLEEATDQDTVILFLSGHGVSLPGDRYYFATTEIDPSTEDTIASTALPWTAFATALSQIKAKHVLMFLDACHSGNALGDREARAENMAEVLAQRSGVIVFSSSRGSEYSYELDNLQHGAFTAALVEGLGQGKANFEVAGVRGTSVTAEQLLAYLRQRVPQLTENRQTPSCPLLEDFGDPFPLVVTGG